MHLSKNKHRHDRLWERAIEEYMGRNSVSVRDVLGDADPRTVKEYCGLAHRLYDWCEMCPVDDNGETLPEAQCEYADSVKCVLNHASHDHRGGLECVFTES